MNGAIVAYDRATQLLPSLTETWFRAGALVYELGHRDEAIGCFRRAAATGGRTYFGRLGNARALLTEDRNQEAERVLRETLVADPRNAMAYDLLGNLLSEFGRFDEARACFERAITMAPLLAGSYYDLVRCRPVTSDDDGLLQSMEAALATPDWKRCNACGFTSRSARRRTTLATMRWPYKTLRRRRRPVRRRCRFVRLGLVFGRERPADACRHHLKLIRGRQNMAVPSVSACSPSACHPACMTRSTRLFPVIPRLGPVGIEFLERARRVAPHWPCHERPLRLHR